MCQREQEGWGREERGEGAAVKDFRVSHGDAFEYGSNYLLAWYPALLCWQSPSHSNQNVFHYSLGLLSPGNVFKPFSMTHSMDRECLLLSLCAVLGPLRRSVQLTLYTNSVRKIQLTVFPLHCHYLFHTRRKWIFIQDIMPSYYCLWKGSFASRTGCRATASGGVPNTRESVPPLTSFKGTKPQPSDRPHSGPNSTECPHVCFRKSVLWCNPGCLTGVCAPPSGFSPS